PRARSRPGPFPTRRSSDLYRILLTRDGERSMDLRERIEFANTNEADLFISLHVNWLPVDSIAPIETYYYGPNSDARALRLAQREDRKSTRLNSSHVKTSYA